MGNTPQNHLPSPSSVVDPRVSAYRAAPEKYRKQLCVRTYELLFEAYANTGSVSAAARAAGVSKSVAHKYIILGVPGFPAIRDRIQRVNDSVLAEQENRLVRHRHLANQVVAEMLNKGLQALERMELQPRGMYVVDEEGNHVLSRDGKPMIAVDETSFKIMSGTFRELIDASHELHKSSQPPPTPPIPVQPIQQNFTIGVGSPDREVIQVGAAKVMQQITQPNGMALLPSDERRVEELLEEELNRRKEDTDGR